MSTNRTPLQVVNEDHGGKEKLVDKILTVLDRGAEDKGALKERLLTAPSRKLLRLLRNSEAVKNTYGSHEKLADTVGSARGRTKDADFMSGLKKATSGRLLDMARTLDPKAAAGAAPAKAKVAKPKKKAAKK